MQSQSISSFDYSQELGSGGGASGGASVGGGDEGSAYGAAQSAISRSDPRSAPPRPRHWSWVFEAMHSAARTSRLTQGRVPHASGALGSMQLRIPDTVLFRNGQPTKMLGTGSDGRVIRHSLATTASALLKTNPNRGAGYEEMVSRDQVRGAARRGCVGGCVGGRWGGWVTLEGWWAGMSWCGMARHGTARHGMAWQLVPPPPHHPHHPHHHHHHHPHHHRHPTADEDSEG